MVFGSDGGSSGRGSISEINVTPLVDVMLVLLVVFMVTTPIIVQGVKREVDVDLPTTNADPVPADQLQTIFTLHADKHIGFAKGRTRRCSWRPARNFRPAWRDSRRSSRPSRPSKTSGRASASSSWRIAPCPTASWSTCCPGCRRRASPTSAW
ncbi:MAG: biopolymer transporter ExbD [bacterium]